MVATAVAVFSFSAPALAQQADIDLTITARADAIHLEWTGGGNSGFGVDRRHYSDNCPNGVCYEHMAWVNGAPVFVDESAQPGVGYSYAVWNVAGAKVGYTDPITLDSSAAARANRAPTGTIGSSGNLTDTFLRNEATHEWLDGAWSLEFGDDFAGTGLDETRWNYFESETHRQSYSCSDNGLGHCRGDNFTPHTSRLDRNHATVGNDALMMNVTASVDENKVQMSFLQTWDDKSGGWETRLQPYAPRSEAGFANHFFGVEEGPLYIEASVNFSQAHPAVGAWWALWLYSPDTWMTPVDRWCEGQIPASSCSANQHPGIFNRPADLDEGFCARPSGYGEGCTFFANANAGLYRNYEQNFSPTDNNANTGMEVDIFEYAPDVTADGFNIALYKTHRFDLEVGGSNPKVKGLRPHGDDFSAYNTHQYLLANAGQQYFDSNTVIDLTEDRYHRLGMYWDANRYSFYLDGHHMWSVTDPAWITQQARNGLRLSWEHSHDLWSAPRPGFIADNDGDGIPQARTFLNAGDEPKVFVDYVKVLRKQ